MLLSFVAYLLYLFLLTTSTFFSKRIFSFSKLTFQ
uniref:Uncharacterized protein n=1 Tax=Siphoviridae sp. ctNZc11 TaxID=2827858 RepID=A0A8S5TDD0_9CAUD|nr:MAG TPA: hypothetical protein [Siphoviridae sp. ctNZc11]